MSFLLRDSTKSNWSVFLKSGHPLLGGVKLESVLIFVPVCICLKICIMTCFPFEGGRDSSFPVWFVPMVS